MSPKPDLILSTLQAYRDAAVLNTALELDLFTRIAHGTDTASRIASELDIPIRGVRLICECLAAAGLILKEDEQLKLTPESAAFLDQKSPQYLGTALRVLYSPALLRGYEHLTAAVRAGTSPAAPKGRPDWFDLARGVSDISAAAGTLADTLDLPTGPLKILEIGGAQGIHPGAFGIALAHRHPDAAVVVLDVSAALSAAQIQAETAGLTTRYQNVPGDPLTTELGLDYDLVFLPGILSQYNESECTSLFMRIHYALKKTGRLAILEFLTEDTPEFSRDYAAFRLNYLASTPHADTWSIPAVKAMLESSGFHAVESKPLPAAAATLITAKP